MKTNTKIGIILCFDSEYCCKPENFLNSICSEIKKELQVNLTIGYGEFVDDIKDLRSSRKNALYALERTFVVQGACVVSYRQVNIYENKVLLINWNSQALINAIEYFDTEQIQSQIDAFTAELAEKSPPQGCRILPGIQYCFQFVLAYQAQRRCTRKNTQLF